MRARTGPGAICMPYLVCLPYSGSVYRGLSSPMAWAYLAMNSGERFMGETKGGPDWSYGGGGGTHSMFSCSMSSLVFSLNSLRASSKVWVVVIMASPFRVSCRMITAASQRDKLTIRWNQAWRKEALKHDGRAGGSEDSLSWPSRLIECNLN